jgi:low affinity Fe/Cu permease
MFLLREGRHALSCHAMEMNFMHSIRRLLTRLGEMAAHPSAFGVLVLYALLWFIFDRGTLDWHAVATLSVWFMTLLIQRAEHRDTQALQAKIDELLPASS